MSFTEKYIMPSVNVADDCIAVYFEAAGKHAYLRKQRVNLFEFNSETV